MNDEAPAFAGLRRGKRMTNDGRMAKPKARKRFVAEFRHLIIRHSFEFRH